jgi:hypothetical protein
MVDWVIVMPDVLEATLLLTLIAPKMGVLVRCLTLEEYQRPHAENDTHCPLPSEDGRFGKIT